MYQRGRHSAGFAATLFALLFAVILRALIPAGYMPEAGGNAFHLEICGSAGAVGTDGGPDPDEGSDGSESVCVFAAATPRAGPTDPPPLPPSPIVAFGHATAPALRDPPTAERSEGPPPPARAPPLPI
ncbi:DUF2946 family protein [Brevundimonas sp.]|uniref:DUF2946 family protein n=1 Tax=Brevundimonas sp. TaxID=1871086 RepID=UPI002CB62B9A|nr:DUF2946 family protein [Brevundimonas sp.]HWQ87167.1 DUF2946 family protein [Brevundimonas sp.]